MSKYFSPSEFKRCTPSCSIDQMDHPFLDGIDQELIDQTMELDSYVLNGEKAKIQPMIETLMNTLGRRNEKCKQMH